MMCGIMITKGKYKGSMKHRGIKTKKRNYEGFKFIHEHLPVQSDLKDNPIIETKRFIILYNGELFNKKYKNDLDFIKEIFEKNNLKNAIKIIIETDGFYSFIIFDKIKNLTFCFTDPLGKKQLYFDNFSIASEIRPLIKKSFDEKYLSDVIKFGYTTNDSTPFENIKRLFPNKLYIFSSYLKLEKILYSNLYEIKREQNNSLYNLINLSVKNRLKSNVNIALLLSGGLDSSIIYHHLKKHKKNIKTYCVDNQNDLHYAKIIDPNVEVLKLEFDEAALFAMEIPIDLGSLYPQYVLFKNVKETVILTGDGADELFGGYGRMNLYDAQMSDIFSELVFYHNVRIDRLGMFNTKEVRSPFMNLDILKYALNLPYPERIEKAHLKEIYKNKLPGEILNRKKEPLKIKELRINRDLEYRVKLIKKWRMLNE